MLYGKPVADIEKVETEIVVHHNNAEYGDEADIAPLLRLRRRSPEFVLAPRDCWACTADESPAMMKAHTNNILWTYFDVAVTRGLIQEKRDGFRIVILVRRGFRETWMDNEHD